MSAIVNFFKGLIGMENQDGLLIGLSGLNHENTDEVYEPPTGFKGEPTLTELLKKSSY